MADKENSNSSNTITISLKDMNGFIFKEKRKVVIIFMLAFALLFGLIRGVTSFMSVGKVTATKEEILAEKTYQKTKKSYEDDIEKVSKKIDDETKYQENSILYNIDASNVYRGNLIYSIVPSNGIDVDTLAILESADSESSTIYSKTDSRMKSTLLSYVSYIKNASFYSEIDDEKDAKYMRELVLATADVESGLIFVSIVGDSEDIVSKLSKAVQGVVDEKTPDIKSRGFSYGIDLISEAYYISADSTSSSVNTASDFAITFSSGEFINVATAKKAHDDTLASYKSTLTNDNTYLNNLQDPNINTEKTASSDAMKATVKAVVEGLLLGLILAFLILMVKYCHEEERKKIS